MMSVGSNVNIFCVDVHMELTPLSSPSACVHLSLTPPPCGGHKWMAPNTSWCDSLSGGISQVAFLVPLRIHTWTHSQLKPSTKKHSSAAVETAENGTGTIWEVACSQGKPIPGCHTNHRTCTGLLAIYVLQFIEGTYDIPITCNYNHVSICSYRLSYVTNNNIVRNYVSLSWCLQQGYQKKLLLSQNER